MVIFGVDPGLAKTGWGVISILGSSASIVDYGIINTLAKDEHVNRLRSIGESLRKKVLQHAPNLICIERVFVNINPKTSLLLGEARGVALGALFFADVPVLEITALQIKQTITGNGRASKDQVALMVRHMLNMGDEKLPPDCFDALACALAGRSGLIHPMPFKKRRGIRPKRKLFR